MADPNFDKEGFYDFLTVELGWTPQEAFEEITTAADEPGAREPDTAPEPPQYDPEPAPMNEGEKMQTALAATDAMRAEEEMLPVNLPSAASIEGDRAQALWRAEGRPQVTPEMASGFSVTPEQHGDVVPTSKGFMYVGRPVEAPSGYVSPQEQAYDRGVASGMIRTPEPGLSPTSIYRTPEYETFAAQDRYNTMFQATGDARKAMEAAGPALIRTTTARGGSGFGFGPMTPYQQAQANRWAALTTSQQNKATAAAAAPATRGLTPNAAVDALRRWTPQQLDTEMSNGITWRQFFNNVVAGGSSPTNRVTAPTAPTPTTTTATSTTAPLPKRRADAANRISAEHPDWSVSRVKQEAIRQIPK